jgi:hypothetical protein
MSIEQSTFPSGAHQNRTVNSVAQPSGWVSHGRVDGRVVSEFANRLVEGRAYILPASTAAEERASPKFLWLAIFQSEVLAVAGREGPSSDWRCTAALRGARPCSEPRVAEFNRRAGPLVDGFW